jgi:hypothetical protein
MDYFFLFSLESNVNAQQHNPVHSFINAYFSSISVGLTNSFFWLGRTFSTLLGQIAVERYGHAASLFGSLIISCIPIAIFSLLMPETNNSRKVKEEDVDKPPLSGLEVDGQKGGSIEYTKMT